LPSEVEGSSVKLFVDDIERFLGRYSIGRDSNPIDVTGSLHFLRIKVPGGLLTTEQFRGIADLVGRYGRERAEVTDRQDIQMHWIQAEDTLDIFSTMESLGFTTDMCGQGFSGAKYGDVRNIVCCPASGIVKEEILDGRPLLTSLTGHFSGNQDFLDLPRKFKISISGCGADCTRAYINDLSFVAVRMGEDRGFTFLVGGSAGVSLPGPRLAKPTGVFVKPDEAFDVAVATVEIYKDHGNRESKAKARFKWLIETWGVSKYVVALEEKLGWALERYDGPIFERRNAHEGVQPQSQEGSWCVNVPLVGGRLSRREMEAIASLADEYGSGELRLTPTQSIIIPNVKRKAMVLKRLARMGFPLHGSSLRWNCMGCASDFCGKTSSPHAKEVVVDVVNHLESSFSDELLEGAGLRIHVSGCFNDCGAASVADIGLIGKQIREGDEMKQVYNVFLGGCGGPEPSLGRLVEENVPTSELKQWIESLLGNYDKRRKPLESFGEFCRRHATHELKTLTKGAEH